MNALQQRTQCERLRSGDADSSPTLLLGREAGCMGDEKSSGVRRIDGSSRSSAVTIMLWLRAIDAEGPQLPGALAARINAMEPWIWRRAHALAATGTDDEPPPSGER